MSLQHNSEQLAHQFRHHQDKKKNTYLQIKDIFFNLPN